MHAIISPDSVIISRADYDAFKNVERLWRDLEAKDQRHKQDNDLANGHGKKTARFISRDGLLSYGTIEAAYPFIKRNLQYRVGYVIQDKPADPLSLTKNHREYKLVDTCMYSGRPVYQEL